MKSRVLLLISLLAAALPSLAAEPGPGSAKPKEVTPTTSLPAGGLQATGNFRIVSQDGLRVLQQAPLFLGTGNINTITIGGGDAFMSGSGHCAFNVKYDEISAKAATGTTNRLFSNDTLIAQNTKIDLQPNVLKTIWTQPYLVPGLNNVKLVINADGEKPSVAWVRINVTGSCGGVTAPAPKTEPPKTQPPKTEPPKTEPPKPQPTVVKYAPGSAQWNTLYTAWGYSNYATTQLKGKGYARYADLARLNADLTAVVNAKSVEAPAYSSLMTRWNSFLNDPAFVAAMKAVVPGSGGK